MKSIILRTFLVLFLGLQGNFFYASSAANKRKAYAEMKNASLVTEEQLALLPPENQVKTLKLQEQFKKIKTRMTNRYVIDPVETVVTEGRSSKKLIGAEYSEYQRNYRLENLEQSHKQHRKADAKYNDNLEKASLMTPEEISQLSPEAQQKILHRQDQYKKRKASANKKLQASEPVVDQNVVQKIDPLTLLNLAAMSRLIAESKTNKNK